MNLLDVLKENPPRSPLEDGYWHKIAKLMGATHHSVRQKAKRILKDRGGTPPIRYLYYKYGAGASEREEKQIIRQVGDSLHYEYSGEKIIDNLNSAIEQSGIDLSEWEVKSQEFKTYTVAMKLKNKEGFHEPKLVTNYYCKVQFAKRAVIDSRLMDALSSVSAVLGTRTASAGSDDGRNIVVFLSDFHYGSKVEKILDTPDFNSDILSDKIASIPAIISTFNPKSVHMFLLGDFIESFTGMNHLSTWKELSSWGFDAVKSVSSILASMAARIPGLDYIGIVNGNHDRTTSDHRVDMHGQVGDMIAYILGHTFPDITVRHDPVLLTENIDGVRYLATHGHRGIEKDVHKLLFNHGEQGVYNFLAVGHKHTRGSKSAPSVSAGVIADYANYRAVTVPPLFTGNFWSAALGFSSSSGFIVVERSASDKVNLFDFTL